MGNNSPDHAWTLPYRCRDCGSEVGFRSRRRTIIERFILPLLFLQPVRCGECFRRDYRLIFTKVRERLSDVSKIASGRPAATTNRNIA